MSYDAEMQRALEADGEKLRQMTGEDHGPYVGLGWVRTQFPEVFVEAPQVWKECPECCGEGGIEVWESVSKWSIDPPCAQVMRCEACNGAGGFICEAEGDRS